MLKSFAILTGSIATEEMPPEAAQYVAELIPEPEKAPEPRIIPGTIESVSNEIGTYLNSLQTTSTDEQTSSHGTLKILKITAELPEHPNVIVSLFFQQLEQKPPEPGELFDISKTSIDIYIIDKL
ncbi:MAG: hypothetical protein GY721_02030 [Deltaproteobacteria bacterium]|nr:hypothetical protein [Deltaproteobacteria bacterium]